MFVPFIETCLAVIETKRETFSKELRDEISAKAKSSPGVKIHVNGSTMFQKPTENYEDVDLSFSYRKADCTGLRYAFSRP